MDWLIKCVRRVCSCLDSARIRHMQCVSTGDRAWLGDPDDEADRGWGGLDD